MFTEYKRTLQRGVTITMTSVRSRYWILSLRQQTKSVTHKYYGYKKYRVLPYPTPPPWSLPLKRTELSMLFQIIVTYYAGPSIIVPNLKNNKKHIFFCLLAVCAGQYI